MDFYTWTHYCWLTCKDLHQIHADTECSFEDQPRMMDNWERERGSKVLRAVSMKWFDEEIKKIQMNFYSKFCS